MKREREEKLRTIHGFSCVVKAKIFISRDVNIFNLCRNETRLEEIRFGG
jgi:hypothetical protein